MFYSSELLSRKGVFGKLWLAGTSKSTKQLSKKAVQDVDVVSMTKELANPKVDLALRAEGILLMGLVVIHDRKCSTLLLDSQEIRMRISAILTISAANSISLDLPPEKLRARFDAVTMQLNSRVKKTGPGPGLSFLPLAISDLDTLPSFALPHAQNMSVVDTEEVRGFRDVERLRGRQSHSSRESSTSAIELQYSNTDSYPVESLQLTFRDDDEDAENAMLEMANGAGVGFAEEIGFGMENDAFVAPASRSDLRAEYTGGPASEARTATTTTSSSRRKRFRQLGTWPVVDDGESLEIPNDEMRRRLDDASAIMLERPEFGQPPPKRIRLFSINMLFNGGRLDVLPGSRAIPLFEKICSVVEGNIYGAGNGILQDKPKRGAKKSAVAKADGHVFDAAGADEELGYGNDDAEYAVRLPVDRDANQNICLDEPEALRAVFDNSTTVKDFVAQFSSPARMSMLSFTGSGSSAERPRRVSALASELLGEEEARESSNAGEALSADSAVARGSKTLANSDSQFVLQESLDTQLVRKPASRRLFGGDIPQTLDSQSEKFLAYVQEELALRDVGNEEAFGHRARPTVGFLKHLTVGASRRMHALAFYRVLILQTLGHVHLSQTEAFGEIEVSA
eukprot:ANDGO_02060.mRNA.1 Sister chromatid cohesion 1 protein 1